MPKRSSLSKRRHYHSLKQKKNRRNDDEVNICSFRNWFRNSQPKSGRRRKHRSIHWSSYISAANTFFPLFCPCHPPRPLRPKFECREPQFTLKLAKMWKNFVNSLFTKKCNLNYSFEIAFFFSILEHYELKSFQNLVTIHVNGISDVNCNG